MNKCTYWMSDVFITEFDPVYQFGVDAVLKSIQDEYPENIYGPGSNKMTDVYNLPGRKYWVALYADNVVGCIGVVILNDNNCCLKSMMLLKTFRGSQTGLSARLLETAISYARYVGSTCIYLGTMIQFLAARFFYLKHGFTPVEEDQLPPDFQKNPVDKIFFKLDLLPANE